MASKIIGTGGYLPQKIVTNSDLADSIDTSDEWIRNRTGITQRHIAADDEYTSHLGYKAALEAIKNAGIERSTIDLIITCTNSPDNSFPSTANKIQSYFGFAKKIPSFDLQAICSGFVYGLQVADCMIKSGKYQTILLICADKMSSLVDWQDRKTCVLFGDGAGAVILQKSNSNAGIIDSDIFSDGSLFNILYTDGGVSSTGDSGTVQMIGGDVFKQACIKMSESVKNILQKNNLDIADISYFIPHQANLRIIDHVANYLNIDKNKVIITVDKHANCSAASIPLALSKLELTRGVKSDEILLFASFGAGATWGAALLRW